jgi:hypothetical protein
MDAFMDDLIVAPKRREDKLNVKQRESMTKVIRELEMIKQAY